MYYLDTSTGVKEDIKIITILIKSSGDFLRVERLSVVICIPEGSLPELSLFLVVIFLISNRNFQTSKAPLESQAQGTPLLSFNKHTDKYCRPTGFWRNFSGV